MTGKLRNMATIYIKCDDEMLMLYRIGSKVVKPSWCGVGGHFEKDELNDAKFAVLREMKEEIGLAEHDLDNFKMKYLCIRNIKNELRLNYYFFADLKCSKDRISSCNEGELKWVKINALNDLEMPFTAQEMMKHYLTVGINDDDFYVCTVDDNLCTFSVVNES